MNLRQLEVFQAVMQAGNMSAAARLVSITPSAVSKTIAHAELQLGYKLFTRSKGLLAPTPEAIVLHGESAAIHGRLQDLRRLAANLRTGGSGPVRLAAIPAVSHAFLPAVLEQHARRHASVNVEVRTLDEDQLPQALLTRGVDFALGFHEHAHPQLGAAILGSGPASIAVTREIWERASRMRRGDPLRFLAHTPMIRLAGDNPLRLHTDTLAQRIGVLHEPIMQVQTSQLALELVRRGLGWSVIDFLTAAHLDAEGIVGIEQDDLPPLNLFVHHATAHPPGQRARRMLDLLRSSIRSGGARRYSAS